MRANAVILAYFTLAVATFLVSDLQVMWGASGLFLLLILLLPFRQLRRGGVPIILFLSMTFVINALFSPGRVVLAAGPVTLTAEGIDIGALRMLRVFLLIASAKIMSSFVTLDEMVRTVGAAVRPLERFGVPVRDFFDTMALAVAALPAIIAALTDEYGRQVRQNGASGIRDRVAIVTGFLLPICYESIREPEAFFCEGTFRNNVSDR